jgi:hypothetical protein
VNDCLENIKRLTSRIFNLQFHKNNYFFLAAFFLFFSGGVLTASFTSSSNVIPSGALTVISYLLFFFLGVGFLAFAMPQSYKVVRQICFILPVDAKTIRA